MMHVGLTGGIASGKSTVSAELARRGALVIDADVLAREVVAPGSEGLSQIRQQFGEQYLGVDGELDRAALGKLVFADEEARGKLNAIVHPLVRARAEQLRQEAEPDAIVVEDIPLLAETGQAGRFNLVVVVEAERETQLARLKEIRRMSEDEAILRLEAQASAPARRAIADVLIENNGSVEELAAQIDRLWQILVQMRTEADGQEKVR